MSGLAVLLKPGQRWKAVLLVLAACAVILAGGVLVGYASGRSRALARQKADGAGADKAVVNQQLDLEQLPLPDSAAVQQWLAQPSTPGWLRDIYTHHQDTAAITAQQTETFLKLMQHALQAGLSTVPHAAAGATVSAADVGTSALALSPDSKHNIRSFSLGATSTSRRAMPTTTLITSSSTTTSLNSSFAVGLQPFIVASGDVLSYLRYKQSQTLLNLLRDFSHNGVKGLAAAASANAGMLRQEMQQLLVPEALQQWYLETASSRVGATGPAHQLEPTVLVNAGQAARPSHRRLLAEDIPFDLTSALLSRMQGTSALTAPAAAAAPARPEAAVVLTAPLTSAGAAGSSAAASVAPYGSATAKMQGAAASSGWVPARTVPRAVTNGIGASAVPLLDPGFLALELEEYGGEPEEAEAEAEAEAEGGSSSNVDETAGMEAGDNAPAAAAATTAEDAQQMPKLADRQHSLRSSKQGRYGANGRGNAHVGHGGGHAAGVTSRYQQQQHAVSPPPVPPPSENSGQPGAEDTLEQGWVTLQSAERAEGAASSTPQTTAVQEQSTATSTVGLVADRSSNVSAPAEATSLPDRQGNSADTSLCAIQQFSPLGLRGAGAAGAAVQCSTGWPSIPLQAGWTFRTITVPIVFHCLAFTREVPRPAAATAAAAAAAAAAASSGGQSSSMQVVLPPSAWHASTAASELIEQANKAFANTGIQFKLLEVRHNPEQYPYLQQPSLDAWQSCTYSSSAPAAGIACLRDVARRAETSEPKLPPHAVHVFVAGSREERAYCSPAQSVGAAACQTLVSGYTHAHGPWMGPPLWTAWREDSIPDNFIFLSWDTFAPATANSARFAFRGGSIFAGQLAQYLGLSSGAKVKAAASTCAPGQLAASSAWCSAFRLGQPAAMRGPAPALDCATDTFGVMEPSVPNDCAMAFSASQVAIMQAAVSTYRPKLVQARSCN